MKLNLKNQIYHVIWSVIILIHNLSNNHYLSFYVETGYHLVTVQNRTGLYERLITEN
jgi:hypothetical protein